MENCYLDTLQRFSYTGILINIESKDVLKLLNTSLTKISESNKENTELPNYINHFNDLSFPKNSNWRFPNDLHITCLFNKGYVRNIDAYRKFENNLKLDVVIKGLIFIPDKIVTLIVYLEEVHVQNKFPHVTALIKDYKPVDSNLVCELLFQEGGVLEKEYKKIIDSDLSNKVLEIVELDIKGKREKVYVYKFDTVVKYSGITKVYYK